MYKKEHAILGSSVELMYAVICTKHALCSVYEVCLKSDIDEKGQTCAGKRNKNAVP